MAAARTFFRRQFRRQEPVVVIDITDSTVVFLLTWETRDNADSRTFRAWATGDEIQLNSDDLPYVDGVQWSMCPASRFNQAAADSEPNNGKLKFIFIQATWLRDKGYSAFTKWLTNNWRGTPKDIGVIYPESSPFGATSISLLLLEFHMACKAANLNIHPLRTVGLSTGWTEENCRGMYKREREWIVDVREYIRKYPGLAKIIHGELRFARMMDKGAAIAAVNLLFTPDL